MLCKNIYIYLAFKSLCDSMKETNFKIPIDFQTYSSSNTIFGVEYSKEITDADVVFIGIPFDLSTSYRSGARFAPSKIREVSRIISGVDFFIRREIFKEITLKDFGDIEVYYDIEKSIKKIENDIYGILGKNRIIIAGGDHLITYSVLKALNKKFGKINLLDLDAHIDSWNTVNHNSLNHGTWLRRTIEEGILKNVYQVGIRGSIYSSKDLEFLKNNNINIIDIRKFKNNGIENIAREINKNLCDERFYLTIDIDVVDPAYAPATGIPEPGGLSSFEIMEFLRHLDFNNFIGGDIVEVSPPYDVSDITSILAANLFFIMLSKLP
ncbi:MAG: agmatinase [Euryarchaeota archaeon]|nr:agmatinase [Euryarchaeota archaeon]MVT36372.1 agmatinase [Euryarchaeota archaeon]